MINPTYNRLIQVALLVLLVVIVAFWLLAARPPARAFGRYPATINVPQPLYGVAGEVIAYTTVSNPAVVSLPPDWKLPDLICMTIRFARNSTSTSPEGSDIYEQSKWDENYHDWMVFDEDAIRSTSRDGTRLKFAAPLLSDFALMREKVTLKLYGLEPIVLEKNRSADSLLCYYHYFFQNDTDVPHTPFYHEVALKARNAAVYAYPAYHFRFNSAPQAADAEGTADLPKIPIQEYLQQISTQSVVQTLSPKQSEQVATETAFIQK